MINIIIPNEEYSNIDDDTKKAVIGGGIAGVTALGVALAQKQKRPLSEVEQICGKKPLIGKGKKQAWQDCSKKLLPQSQVPIGNETTKKDNKMLYIIGGSILGLGIVAFTIYKIKNK